MLGSPSPGRLYNGDLMPVGFEVPILRYFLPFLPFPRQLTTALFFINNRHRSVSMA